MAGIIYYETSNKSFAIEGSIIINKKEDLYGSLEVKDYKIFDEELDKVIHVAKFIYSFKTYKDENKFKISLKYRINEDKLYLSNFDIYSKYFVKIRQVKNIFKTTIFPYYIERNIDVSNNRVLYNDLVNNLYLEYSKETIYNEKYDRKELYKVFKKYLMIMFYTFDLNNRLSNYKELFINYYNIFYNEYVLINGNNTVDNNIVNFICDKLYNVFGEMLLKNYN